MGKEDDIKKFFGVPSTPEEYAGRVNVAKERMGNYYAGNGLTTKAEDGNTVVATETIRGVYHVLCAPEDVDESISLMRKEVTWGQKCVKCKALIWKDRDGKVSGV